MTTMNKYIKKAVLMGCMASAFTLTACIDEVEPTTVASENQVANSTEAQQALVNGLVATLVEYDTYGYDGTLWDWGYPCQMFYREVMGEDFAIESPSYDYWTDIETGTYLTTAVNYSYYYYYRIVRNANELAKSINPATATELSRNYLGLAHAFRALAYLDMTRMYEWKDCGIAELDNEAAEKQVKGLTVSIVTENTTNEQARNNPRAPFYTMYRFIYSDLQKAKSYLEGYTRNNKAEADQSVAYGLLARFWLELGSRFEDAPDDLATQLAHENDADGYAALDIQTARDCFENAIICARQAMTFGYTPLTCEEWHNPKTGFNSASSNAWMWGAIVNSQEQVNPYYWNSFVASIASETTYGPRYDNIFRTMSKALYDQIPDADWRKTSWVDPLDVNASTVPAKYQTNLKDSEWKELCAYANLKFRPGNGATEDYDEGLIADVPMMRIEEMYFIEAEALAHTAGVSNGAEALTRFIQTYRYTDEYQCEAADLQTFNKELMQQKRIEFWGEGILYFDYKRLKRTVTRDYDGSNWPESMRLNSVPGYVPGWMNVYVPEWEKERNPAVVLNPDPSGRV